MPNNTLQVPQSQAPALNGLANFFTTVWYLFFQQLAQDIPQVGDCIVQATPGDVSNGYLECNGSAVSRTQYAKLFASIGISYGAGDGVSTFNLPNFASPGAPAVWKIRFQ